MRIHPSIDVKEGQSLAVRVPPEACSVLTFH
jgi:hypothetical protein